MFFKSFAYQKQILEDGILFDILYRVIYCSWEIYFFIEIRPASSQSTFEVFLKGGFNIEEFKSRIDSTDKKIDIMVFFDSKESNNPEIIAELKNLFFSYLEFIRTSIIAKINDF